MKNDRKTVILSTSHVLLCCILWVFSVIQMLHFKSVHENKTLIMILVDCISFFVIIYSGTFYCRRWFVALRDVLTDHRTIFPRIQKSCNLMQHMKNCSKTDKPHFPTYSVEICKSIKIFHQFTTNIVALIASEIFLITITCPVRKSSLACLHIKIVTQFHFPGSVKGSSPRQVKRQYQNRDIFN